MHISHPIATPRNDTILLVVLMVHALVLFLLPKLVMHSPYWGVLLLFAIWLNLVQWALLHEAIHKLLFASRRANEWGGRFLAMLMGTSFDTLRFGHLIHHQLNRRFYAEPPTLTNVSQKLHYYANMLGGVYVHEVVSSWLMTLLPRHIFLTLMRYSFLKGHEDVVIAGDRLFYVRGKIRQVRIDTILGGALYSYAFFIYGSQWLWLVVFIALRGLVISFMDNIYHFATPHDNSKAAKELALPLSLSRLMLHGNYHETHHLNPDISWRELPRYHQAQQRQFEGSLWHHGWMQLQFKSR